MAHLEPSRVRAALFGMGEEAMPSRPSILWLPHTCTIEKSLVLYNEIRVFKIDIHQQHLSFDMDSINEFSRRTRRLEGKTVACQRSMNHLAWCEERNIAPTKKEVTSVGMNCIPEASVSSRRALPPRRSRCIALFNVRSAAAAAAAESISTRLCSALKASRLDH